MDQLQNDIFSLYDEEITLDDIREEYRLLAGEDPFDLLELMDEFHAHFMPRDEIERQLVEEAALSAFRLRRADTLLNAVNPSGAVKADMLEEFENAQAVVREYRAQAARHHRWALHELSMLQACDDLPNADILPFPGQGTRGHGARD